MKVAQEKGYMTTKSAKVRDFT